MRQDKEDKEDEEDEDEEEEAIFCFPIHRSLKFKRYVREINYSVRGRCVL